MVRHGFLIAISALFLSFFFFLSLEFSFAVDSPHNSVNGIDCTNCHDALKSSTTPTWWSQQDVNVCGQCHNTASKSGQDVVTHKNISGVLIQCTVCHDPHRQQQNRTWKSASYLFTGTSDLLTGITRTSLTCSTANWFPDQWKDMLLIPNVLAPAYNYKIVSNSAKTLYIDTNGVPPGNEIVTSIQPGSTFAIVWGRYVKPNIGGRLVKFFRETGTNSFADSDATIDGVCQVCHTKTTSFNNNGTLEGSGHPASEAGQKCSGCHDHQAGFKASCKDCHGTPPTVNTVGGPDGLAKGNSDSGPGSTTAGAHSKHAVTMKIVCKTCHTGGMPDSAIKDDKQIQIGFAVGSFATGTYDGRTSLANGYTYSSGNPGTKITQNGSGVCSSVYCHTNGTSVVTGSISDVSSPNWSTGSINSCTACHGFPPSYENNSPKANSHGSHNYSCENCHYNTTTTGTSITNPSYHANGSYDLVSGPGRSFSYSFSFPRGTCSNVSCHSNTGTAWGASACLDCHSIQQGGRAPIKSQFETNSHHIQGVGVIDGRHCYRCHWEANYDGSINQAFHGGSAAPASPVDLVIYGAGTRPLNYESGVTAVSYTANGQRTEIAKITSHCLGCHSDQNNSTDIFGDGKTPKQYAWDGTSIDARYSQLGLTKWGKYAGTANAAKKDINKAYSAHGNAAANQAGWNTATGVDDIIADSTGSAAVQCFDCHNSHGSAVSGVTANYTSSTLNGGILKNTTKDAGGYLVDYQPVPGGSPDTKSAYNPGAALCFDCHMNQTASTTPWGYATFGATTAILGYWDSEYFGPLGSFGSQRRYPYKFTGHQGGHFGESSGQGLSNPAVKSINGLCTPCHDPHGVSPSISSCSQSGYYTKASCESGGGTWAPTPQYAVPLLKGTFLTSPYKEDAAPADTRAGIIFNEGIPYHIDQNTFGANTAAAVAGISETDSQFAGLCLECHPKTNLTTTDTPNSSLTWKSKDRIHRTVKGWGNPVNTKHNYSCSKCHTTHNSRLPRLMVTNCLNTSHKSRTGLNSAPTLNAGGSGYSGDYSPECSGNPLFCYDNGWGGGGSGSGRFPGTYSSSGSNAPGTFTVSCHENNTRSGTDQAWNDRTPWSDDRVLIKSGPSAGNFRSSGSDIQATVTWTTDKLSDSCVDFGLTQNYGTTNCNGTYVTSHSMTITMPGNTNHSTYHYRVRSLTTSSPDNTFYISVGPSVPVPRTTQPFLCASTCSATVSWNASTDIDSGSLEYQVEIDTSTAFNTANKQTSEWLSATTWSPTLATNNTWYYHVRARDQNHSEAVSGFSSPYSFLMSNLIMSGPTAGQFSASGSNVQATITWSTQVSSYGAVDYGPTASYGLSSAYEGWVTANHSVALSNLTNHSTYHYRVRFKDSFSDEIISAADYTFSVSVAPTAPVLAGPANGSTTLSPTPYDAPLQWNASTDPDGTAEQLQYFVEIDSNNPPVSTSPNYRNSGWLTGLAGVNTWTTLALPTDAAWYWRVKTRHLDAESGWSGVYFFNVSSVQPPPSPTVLPHGNYDSGCSATAVTVTWNPVTAPDGDLVQYRVYTNAYGDSGWLPVGQTNWTLTNNAGAGVTWWVKARDANPAHLVAESPYSGTDYFADAGSSCSGSCPMLYTWDGSKFAWESDQYPTGKMGLMTASGYVKPNPNDLYLLVNQPAPNAGGSLELRMVEERSETDYFDKVRLYTVDMPMDKNVFAEIIPFGSADIVDPSAALHTVNSVLAKPVSIIHLNSGRNVTSLLSASDQNYLMLNEDKNLFEWQTLEINFGNIEQPPMLKLIIDAMSVFPTTSEGIALAAKLSTTPERTRLEVLDTNGNWVEVPRTKVILSKPMEFRRPYVVNLSNIFLTNIYKIRLSFLYKTYVDSVLFDTTDDAPIGITEVQLTSADLHYYGASARTSSNEIYGFIYGLRADVQYTYMPGNYTRYGDVTPLLTANDDKFVIFGGGDELRLSFNGVSPQPPAAARRFLLYTHGYYKDFKKNAIIDKTVEPLPFNAMSNFPYDPAVENYPDDEDHNQYRLEYNTRIQ